MNTYSGFWLGSGRMILSALLFSLMSLLVRLDSGVSSYLVTFIRFLIGLLILFGMGFAGIIKLKPVNIRWLIIRGVFGTFAVLLLYVGISRIGLGKGTMLNYSYPVFAAALSPLIVGERNSLRIWITLLLALGGCYLLLSPEGFFRFKGIEILVLSGALCAGVAVNSIRKLSRTDNAYTIYTSFCLAGVIIMGVPAFSGTLCYPAYTWLLLVAVGVLATIAQLLMTAAYRYTRVAEGSIIAFLVPVLNAILGALIFGERFGWKSILGCVIVIGCCIHVSFLKQQEALVTSQN